MAGEIPFDPNGLEFCCTVVPDPHMLDYNGHLNIAYYGILFEEAARRVCARLDVSKAYRERTDCALFAAEIHGVFHREVFEREAVSLFCRLLDFDGRKLHCMFFMVRSNDHTLAATQEILYLHIDLQRRRVVEFPEPQATRLSGLLQSHRGKPLPIEMGRHIGLRGRTGKSFPDAGDKA